MVGQRSIVTLAGLWPLIHHSLRSQRRSRRKLPLLVEAITSFLLLFQVTASILFIAPSCYEWYSRGLYGVVAFLLSTPISVELNPLATLRSAGRWGDIRNSVLEAEYSMYGGPPSRPRNRLFIEQCFQCVLLSVVLGLRHVSMHLHLNRMWVSFCFPCSAST